MMEPVSQCEASFKDQWQGGDLWSRIHPWSFQEAKHSGDHGCSMNDWAGVPTCVIMDFHWNESNKDVFYPGQDTLIEEDKLFAGLEYDAVDADRLIPGFCHVCEEEQHAFTVRCPHSFRREFRLSFSITVSILVFHASNCCRNGAVGRRHFWSRCFWRFII